MIDSSIAIIFSVLRDGQRGFWFNQNVAFISSPVYVDATIYYPRQFCVAFNLDAQLFYVWFLTLSPISIFLPCTVLCLLAAATLHSKTIECANVFLILYRWNWICSQLFLMVIVVTAVCCTPIQLRPGHTKRRAHTHTNRSNSIHFINIVKCQIFKQVF